MIFPILRGLLAIRLAPLTYLFFALNLLVFFVTNDKSIDFDQRMDQILTDTRFQSTQGAAFASMILQSHSGTGARIKQYSPMLVHMAENAINGDDQARRALANLAIRNNLFMDQAAKYDFAGDQVAVGEWRQKFTDLIELEKDHPSYQWGISRINSGWMQYVTYQFAHSGFLHLFWNMVFMLLFGCFVEAELGATVFVLTYIGSGLIGAVFYAAFSGISSSPLVGASASISGLMALVGLHWFRRGGLRLFFWLLPLKGYFGFAKLPSWLVLFVFLLPDLSGALGASADFGAVAFTAHLGGAVFGFAISGLIRARWLNVERKLSKSPLANQLWR